LRAKIPRSRQAVALAVALVAVALGLVPLRPAPLLLIGRPDMAALGLR
jgi:hypothetical protein